MKEKIFRIMEITGFFVLCFAFLSVTACHVHPEQFQEVVQIQHNHPKKCRKVYVEREFYHKKRHKWIKQNHTVRECKECGQNGCHWKAQ